MDTRLGCRYRHGRLLGLGDLCGVPGGLKITAADNHAGLDESGRVISPARMIMVSANGPGRRVMSRSYFPGLIRVDGSLMDIDGEETH